MNIKRVEYANNNDYKTTRKSARLCCFDSTAAAAAAVAVRPNAVNLKIDGNGKKAFELTEEKKCFACVRAYSFRTLFCIDENI